MRRSSLFPVAVSVLLALTHSAVADERTVAGRVTDADGKPIAGAKVASFWEWKDDAMKPYKASVSEADGSFTAKVNYYDKPVVLMAIHDKSGRGGLVRLDEETIDKPVAITLAPLVSLHGKFESAGLGRKLEWTNVYMSVEPGRVRIAGSQSTEATFGFKLPPGDYWFWAYGRDLQRHQVAVTLTADKPVVDMGVIDIPPSIIARHYGKAPPNWRVSDARGAGKDAKLSDYKGKWVLLEFWGFW